MGRVVLLSRRGATVRSIVVATILLGGIVLAGPDVALACPDCKDNLANQGGDLSAGFALSIVLMLGTPMTILAAWGTWLVRYVSVEP